MNMFQNDYASPECQEHFYKDQGIENPHPVVIRRKQRAQENNAESDQPMEMVDGEEGMERFAAYEYQVSREETGEYPREHSRSRSRSRDKWQRRIRSSPRDRKPKIGEGVFLFLCVPEISA